MKLYKFLTLPLLLSNLAYAESEKDLITKMCHDNAIKIVNKDFYSYIQDFHPKVESIKKSKQFLHKKFLKKAARYEDSIKTADYNRISFSTEEGKKNTFFDVEKSVIVEIEFLNIKKGSNHFLCQYGLDKDSQKWFKTSL